MLVAGSLVASVFVLGAHIGATDARIPRCLEATARFECYRDRYHALVHAQGVDAAFGALRRDYLASETVRSTCHQLAHAIAHGAAHGDVASQPDGDRGDHFCGSGYYAGTVEAFVTGARGRGVLSTPAFVCNGPRKTAPRSNQHATCAHALGHGLMARVRGRLPQALKACDQLLDSWERDRCYAGAFMDNISGAAARGGRRPSHLTRTRPLAPCPDVAERYRAPCYRQQPAYALYVLQGDFAAVLRLCEAIPERRHRTACGEGVGVNAAATSLADRITETGAAAATDVLCSLSAAVELVGSCVAGAVKQFVDHHRSRHAGHLFCAAVPTRFRTACRRTGRAYFATL